MFSTRSSTICKRVTSSFPSKSFSTTLTLPSSKSTNFCVDMVKRRDYEHFLTNLLLPNHLRSAAFAIRAFNAEISSVRDLVSERTTGRIRMQWWRDALEEIYSDAQPRKHPIVLELNHIIKTHGLSKELFLRMVSSREQFLSDKPFQTLDDVDAYAENAFSSVYFLLLECHSQEGEVKGHARHAANQLGKAEGLVTLLRGVPHNAAKRRVYLPTSLLANYKVSSEMIVRGNSEEAVRNVFEVTAARAQDHLDNCRFRKKYLDRDTKLLMLPAVSVDSYLDRLHKAKCNVFDPKLQVRNSWLPISLYAYKFRGTY